MGSFSARIFAALVFAVTLGLGTSQAFADESNKINLDIANSSSGADQAGSLFAAALQMDLDKTGAFAYTSDSKTVRFRLEIQTIGMEGISSIVSVYKVVLTLVDDANNSYYINSWAGYAGRDKAPAMGAQVGLEVRGAIVSVYKSANPEPLPAKNPIGYKPRDAA